MAEEQSLDEVRDEQAEGYRLAVLTHLTSWVQVLTGVPADPEKPDSASIAWSLQKAYEKLLKMQPNPASDVIGADGVLMIQSAAHLMFRASQHSGVDRAAEWRCVRATVTLLDEAYKDIKSWQRYSDFGRRHPELRIE
ncbi:hypothetical protein ACLGIH_19805 [Streptomyces sp. HMX87]|uniref:hypothetical protein n=1 Tax=Streptomyces sp. HMX87 TaxID=3390849 RepID=UPI003A8A3D6B